MTITLTKLYELLSSRLGKPEAETLTTYIEEKIADDFEKNKLSIISEIKIEFEKMRVENERSRVEVERSLKSQLWAMIALFIPLYITITIALINLLQRNAE